MIGKDQQEEKSPSWFNVDECMRVLEHVRDLLRPHNGCALRLTDNDIGVIAPYNKQVQKLKRLFKAESLDNVKVGSTEMFQGQEKKVIIITSVRSSEDWVGSDVRHNLGFLDNPSASTSRSRALKRFSSSSATRSSSASTTTGARCCGRASTWARTAACRCRQCPAASRTSSRRASRTTSGS